ncbi:WD40 repeat-like protein [Leucogyrophana mollusca]|uniref:WD40 repeat-like protein n=1 Tax=Leucogyrophana mollusca TaxID=85980 RepID=A0ACB8BDE1_9AGAM|nr:WD40 repeat-like protein [Leucogyrophana mollusca]
MSVDYKSLECTIGDIQVVGLQGETRPARPCKPYATLNIDGNLKRTKVAPRGTVSWDDALSFFVQLESLLEVRIYEHRGAGRDLCIGILKEGIGDILSRANARVVSVQLPLRDTIVNLPLHIKFTITISSFSQPIVSQIHDAEEKALNMQMIPHPLESVQSRVGVLDQPVSNVWQVLLRKVKVFAKIVDGISEIHPYAKMAWSVLSAAYQIAVTQGNRDQNVLGLVEIMSDAYTFVHDADPLKKIESHSQVICMLSQQTIECAYFIRDYAKKKSFWMRTVKYMLSDVDARIQQYSDKFKSLMSALQGLAVVHTEISVLRALDGVKDIAAEVDLNDMPYADGARYHPEKICFPGTREQIIEQICDWANNDSNTRLFLLIGAAGSGKSAIAHTIARRFDAIGRLGSSYCFDRSRQYARRPENLFSTIARDLADLNPQYKRSLWQIVKDRRSLRTTTSIREQFEKFILAPTSDLASVGPVVIVIDALDESGDEAARAPLLSLLANEIPKLPPHFRILVTTRHEEDIMLAFERSRHFFPHISIDVDAKSTANDISKFVTAQLADVWSIERHRLNKQRCQLLVDNSGGLFQWASTACQFVKGNRENNRDPSEQLNAILHAGSPTTSSGSLDRLYHDLLSHLFNTRDQSCMTRFRSVMGLVLAVREPLSVSALRTLYRDPQAAEAIGSIVRPLGSLLEGAAEDLIPVHPLHVSFRDFLTDRTRSGEFFIDINLQNRRLALASLNVMKMDLRFNIYDFKTSYVFAKEIPDLRHRIKKAVSAQLSYACRFWIDHVWSTMGDTRLVGEVEDFLYNRLLFWLEVLALTKDGITVASRALLSLHDWSNNGYTRAFVKDASELVAVFGGIFAQSPPHIYLTALPFAPTQSKVARHYLKSYPRTLSVLAGGIPYWPSLQLAFEGHRHFVSSAIFSPDGRRVVSGSRDKTLRVWDAESGEVILRPLEGHDGWITSVAFSPNGKQVASGSYDKTIRVWNVESGEMVLGPLRGHFSRVNSVAFSPDGTMVVSGSGDKTLYLWDATSGEPIFRPLEGHTGEVRSVAFSPDGKHITSGSTDCTVRVWDAGSGQAALAPFVGHTNHVNTVAYSPDGRQIASGSYDRTIRIWDATNGMLASPPIRAHNDGVNSVAFSPDGKRLASGSLDRTIMIWEVETGCCISGPFEGHFGDILSVVFSPDGKRILSGSGDRTMRMWKAKMKERRIASRPFSGHSDAIRHITISPDGQHVASASCDRTVCIWDAKTGNAAMTPLTGHKDDVESVSFAPNGKRICSGSLDETLLMWNMNTGTEVSLGIGGHSGGVRSVAFSPDGRNIASGSADRTVCMRDMTGVVLWRSLAHRLTIKSVAFSPDSAYVVSGSSDKTIRVWKVGSGEDVFGPLRGHVGSVNSVAFSPEGSRIISGSDDGTIRFWNAQTGKLIPPLIKAHDDWIGSVCFSPDGKYVASSSDDATIRIWDAWTGESAGAPLEGHTDSVNTVVYSRDGKQILSASDDCTIRVWDVETMNDDSTSKAKQRSRDDGSFSIPTCARTVNKLHFPAVRPSADWKFDHGWIRDSQTGVLLFWLPPWARTGLWVPRNVLVISKTQTKLDFSKFAHGTAWVQCRG